MAAFKNGISDGLYQELFKYLGYLYILKSPTMALGIKYTALRVLVQIFLWLILYHAYFWPCLYSRELNLSVVPRKRLEYNLIQSTEPFSVKYKQKPQ